MASRRAKISRRMALYLIVLVLSLLALSVLAWLPALIAPAPSRQELALVTDAAKRMELHAAATKLQNDVRATGLQAIAGAVVAIGAIAAWRQLQVGRQQLVVSQEGQITERFTRAVDQLGNKSVDVRTGGIFALARIAKDSPSDVAAVAETISAYVQVHSPWPPYKEDRSGMDDGDLRPPRARGPRRASRNSR